MLSPKPTTLKLTTAPSHLRLNLFSSSVPAGFPSPADDHIEGKLDLNEHLVRRPAATFFVRASGESMKDAGIFDGDLLVIDIGQKPEYASNLLGGIMKKYAVVIAILVSQPTATLAQRYDLETHDMLAAYCQMQSGFMRMTIINKIQHKMTNDKIKEIIINKLQNRNARIWLSTILKDTDVLLNFLENMSYSDKKFAENNLDKWSENVSTYQYQNCLSKLP